MQLSRSDPSLPRPSLLMESPARGEWVAAEWRWYTESDRNRIINMWQFTLLTIGIDPVSRSMAWSMHRQTTRARLRSTRRVFVIWRRNRAWCWDVRSKSKAVVDARRCRHMTVLLAQWQRILATHSMWQRRARLRVVYGLRRQLPEGLVHRIWTFLTIFGETEWKIASSRQAWMQEWSPWFEVLLICAEHDLPAVNLNVHVT